jgi:hypothetical protein
LRGGEWCHRVGRKEDNGLLGCLVRGLSHYEIVALTVCFHGDRISDSGNKIIATCN